MMIEQNTNYAYKIKYMGNPTFDKVRDLSTKFYLELPQELKDELYEALHRGIDILDSEPQMTAYIFAYGKMHQAKLNYAFDKLSDNFFEQEEINIIDYGCGQAIGTMCYADFLRKNHYTQKIKTITLIEPSEICLKRAALHTSVFFPDAEIKTVNKGFNGLNEKDIVCNENIPTLHILSNVLDILNFDIYNFAELIKNNLKGKNQFVCVAPYYNGNEKDNRMDLFANKINGTNIITCKHKANEFIPEKEWTCKMICFQKNMGSIEMIEDSGLDSPISAATQMTDEPHSIDYAITSIKELREEGFNVIHITSQKDNKNYLKIIKGSRFILLEDKISKTISDDAPLKVSIWHYNDNGKIRTVSLGKIENLDIEKTNSEDLEQHTIYYEADEKLHEQWIDENSISHEFANGKGKIRLKDSVTEIGYNAFENCSGLKSVIIPNSVTSIGNHAFSSCSRLKSIAIPNSVTIIGDFAFYYCSKLTNVIIPNSVTSIGYRAFDNCHSITSIIIPESVTKIDGAAFHECNNLTTVSFNASNCIEMGNSSYSVFSHCNALTKLNIGNKVTRIPKYAFDNCHELTSINYAGDLDNWCRIIFDNQPLSYGHNLYINNNLVTNLVIPKTITEIKERTFSGATRLSSVTIPSSVTSIGESAFECSGLSSVTIPNSVTSIGHFAFNGCSRLTSVTIPNSVTSIGAYAFNGCDGLSEITIPNSVTEIGEEAFVSCSGLTTINFNATNCIYMGHAESAFIYCSSLETLNIGKNVKIIPDLAFSDCSGLTSINIPDSVTKIGMSAFSGCSGLTSINIPDSVTEIGGSAFSGCSGLTSINIPDKVKYIGNWAFADCLNLTTISIPNSVTEIDECAFGGCKSLKEIIISKGTKEKFKNLLAKDKYLWNILIEK